ncbi:hypothetical protein RHSIM_Rhsim05G0164500 [Rhododendron simsii]|uniref:Phosphoglycolate phosphatase n=1 Tax=Rhododendron simsii TaxID=118357 RepID=A0A834GZY1_RHOSS|nr:hypothetical protein RHSIM_Rhsim05G0164500 [Rhododendron simsii]
MFGRAGTVLVSASSSSSTTTLYNPAKNPSPFLGLLNKNSSRRSKSFVSAPLYGSVIRRGYYTSSSRMESSSSSFVARASAQPLANADALIDSVETFIFDCDGVIWKGDKLIDGVPDTLDMLRSKGKRLVFVTNNSTKSRKQYGKKFETLGLNVSEEEIFASSFAAAAYLKSINFPTDKKVRSGVVGLWCELQGIRSFGQPPLSKDLLRGLAGPQVYVIGEDGILKELELAGFQYLGGPVCRNPDIYYPAGTNLESQESQAPKLRMKEDLRDSGPRLKNGQLEDDGGKKIELKPGFLMEHDHNVGAVVVGFDRYFNYYKVQYGTLCIRENPGCLFIATNRDAVTHLTDAQEWAGGGSMVGALVGSTQREPLVVGKPSTFMMEYLANKFGIQKSQICMVGDRLDTDILFGQNGGCKTLLVLSGVTSLSMLQNPNNSIQPDFYTNKISDFLSLRAATV